MIDLYASSAPNGGKVSMTVEEMDLDYSVQPIDLSKGEKKEDAYVALDPNGRIPTIVHHDNGDFAVFETGAIMVYLAVRTGQLMVQNEKMPFAEDTMADVPNGWYRADDGSGEWLLSLCARENSVCH